MENNDRIGDLEERFRKLATQVERLEERFEKLEGQVGDLAKRLTSVGVIQGGERLP